LTENETPWAAVRIRINALPESGELEEFDLRRFRPGETYDVPPQLAWLLIAEGYADVVSRHVDPREAGDGPGRSTPGGRSQK
jgi:hypothetical protein